MTKRKGMTKAEAFQQMSKRVEHLEMSNKVFQGIVQRFGQSFSDMEKDVSALATSQRDIQYKVLALTELLSVDNEALNSKIESLQINDFEKASNKEDLEKDLSPADIVVNDSIVTFTTRTENDKDILRSKVDLSEVNHPDFVSAVLGKIKGEEFTTTINEELHTVTVLDIKAKPNLPVPTVEPVQTEAGAN